MHYVTVEEFELLSFFEVEPVRADKDIPWPYNDFSYNVDLGQYTIQFGITPAYKDLSVSITSSGAEIYSFTALSVHDVVYHNHPDREILEIIVSRRESIWLQIRPRLSIKQSLSSET